MRVVVLCGLPGVGKLTIANGLSKVRGYRVFHNHLVFDAVEALFPFDSPAFAELRNRLWLELLSRAVRERVGDVIFTIARDRAVDADFLGRLVAELAELRAQVHCIELTCSASELDARVASVERARFGKIHFAERFRELQAAGSFPLFSMPRGTITVDTTGLSVQEAVAVVDAKIAYAPCAA